MHTYYEFFAGGGMARAGLGEGWRCLYANDLDLKKTACYARNWGSQELHVEDVNRVGTEDLPGTADLAWASFPCQDLSLAGVGRGLGGSHSGTFWPFWSLIESLCAERRSPATIVLENVCGALRSHGGRDFAAIAEAVVLAGYRVGALILDAVHFTPQSRPRLFIVAVRSDLEVPKSLVGEAPDKRWHSPALLDAYAGLSPQSMNRWVWWWLPAPAERAISLDELIEESPKRVEWHSKDQTERLLSLMSDINLGKVAAAKKLGKRTVGTVYKRTRRDKNGRRRQRAEVRFDGVAGCLRTPTGGSSRQTVIVVNGETVRTRLLSPREAARLMGLSDDYWLPSNYNEAYHVAGDGLVVPVVRYLAQHLIEPILMFQASADAA